MSTKGISRALISVYHKDGLESIVKALDELGVEIVSTGGTADYIENLGFKVTKVEQLTKYPSIFGGRVKTLHPLIFGAILMRGEQDAKEAKKYKIKPIDLVVVDLYPFEQALAKGKTLDELIELIDIGGISLIRAAAKNYKEVLVVSNRSQYADLLTILTQNKGQTTEEQRKTFAVEAFKVSSHYDTAIYKYFVEDPFDALKISENESYELRYGENPHQNAKFFGKLGDIFEQLHGKQLSYNNLLDVDSALNLIADFEEPTYAVIKHTNACGIASDEDLTQAWKKALAGDPESAFGGIIVTNRQVDAATAKLINQLFFEIIIAPGYEDQALDILKQKKNRRILVLKRKLQNNLLVRSALDGYLVQEKDTFIDTKNNLKVVTKREPSPSELEDLLYGIRVVKHFKSNAIAIVKNKQLIGSGVGQTSRVDALRQAIEKAKRFGFDLKGAILASDAFFPFADSVELAYKNGIEAVIQPGGSIRDQDSIDFCNAHNMTMVFTGIRHFKH